ncbi:WD40 repeat-like protein [Lophium mytilinum]|uniref:WD40 repeat-like protein n=1 Tax=Lophium mytilinum TaxID=390894 RepID=A0A6A6QZT8_9PEZI|nr:WD40 repeat-like protein [Lophium mytilinum]
MPAQKTATLRTLTIAEAQGSDHGHCSVGALYSRLVPVFASVQLRLLKVRLLKETLAKNRESGRLSSEQSQAAAPASPSSPTATANHDASSTPGTASPNINESENCSTTGGWDKIVSDHSGQTTPSVLLPVASPTINERQEATKGSQTSEQPGVQIDAITQDSLKVDPIPILTPYRTPEKDVAWLWNAAYDQLMTENPKTLHQYELVVSTYIATGRRPNLNPRRFSMRPELVSTAPVDHRARKTLMDNCLDALLREAVPIADGSTTSNDDERSIGDESTTGGDTMDRGPYRSTDEAGEVGRVEESNARSLKDKLREMVHETQHASLAWVATYLAMNVWLHPSFLPDAAHLGAIPIFAKMQWYIGLSKLLSQDTHREAEEYLNGNGNQLNMNSLVGMVVQLYRSILWYQISIVCCHRGSVERPHRPAEPLVDAVEFEKYERNVRMKEDELASFDGRKLQEGLKGFNNHRKPEQEDVATGETIATLRALLEKLKVVEQPIINLKTIDQSASNLLYNWASSTQEYESFLAWGTNPNERVLWLHGGPGAGKTMLLQMAVQELREDEDSSSLGKQKKVAYFFCDSSRPRQATALSAVKSLIYHILKSQPSLSKHLEYKFEMTDEENFDDKNDFYAMSTVLYALLMDESFQQTYFIIDAIEELVPDKDIDSVNHHVAKNGEEPSAQRDERGLGDLFSLIRTTTELSDKVQWLVSLDSDRCSARLARAKENTQLQLTIRPDLKPIREATHSYAVSKINEIANQRGYNSILREKMIQKTGENLGNFLWLNMALDIIKASPTPWNAPTIMEELKVKAPDIDTMYLNRFKEMEGFTEIDKDYCMRALSAVAVAYRPLLETELEDILSLPSEVNLSLLVEGILSPFLGSYDDKGSNGRRISFVHLSAKDFIRKKLRVQGLGTEHSKMAIRCLDILQQAVKASGPALPLDYAAIFWIRHLSEVNSEDGGEAIAKAEDFLNKYSVEWLDVLDSLNLLSQTSAMLAELDFALKMQNADIVYTQDFRLMIRDFSTLLKVHRTSTTKDKNYKNILAGPNNSLLFWPSRTSLKQKLLKKHFSWLDAAPSIDPSGTASDACLHSMNHDDYVRGCTFSLDGRIVASASDDRRVRLWDVKTGKLQHVLEGFNDYVYSVVISKSGPNERALLAAFESSVIRVWELYTGKLVGTLADFVDATKDIEPVDKADDGEDEDGNKNDCEDVGTPQEKEGQDGREDKESDTSESVNDDMGQQTNVESISITQDGKWLAAATGRHVTVWDIPEFNHTPWKDEESTDNLRRVIFSKEGSLLASSAGSQITIWNATTGKVKRRLPESRPRSSDGASEDPMGTPGYDASSDRTQEAETSRENASEERAQETMISEDRVSEGGLYVEAEAEAPELSAGHKGDIDGLAFSPDSKFLASGSDDGTARIWDVDKGRTMAVLLYHKTHVNSVSFSSDGVYLATGSSDKTIGIWKRPGSGGWGCGLTLRQPDQVLKGHSSMVFSVAFAYEGRFLASCTSDDLRIWDTDANAAREVASETAKPQLSYHRRLSSPASTGAGHAQDVSCVAISQNGEMIASASSDGVICLWDGIKGVRLCTMDEKHNGIVKALVFSQDGERLVSASSDCSAIVWEVGVGKAGLVHRLEGHKDWIRAAAMSPDRSLVATGSDDTTVRVWNISAGEGETATKEEEREGSVPCKVLGGHDGWVYSVAFSPNGLNLASGGDDGHVMTWDLGGQEYEHAPGKCLGNNFGPGRIRGLVFLAGSERLLTVDNYGEIAVWNPHDPEQERCILKVENESDQQDFTSLQILGSHPDVLLNEFGAWPFELDVAALRGEASSSLQCPGREMPPPWSPVRIIGSRIIWSKSKEIYLPAEFQPAFSSSYRVCRVQGHSAVVGCDSGQVLLFRFSETETPKEAHNGENEHSGDINNSKSQREK